MATYIISPYQWIWKKYGLQYILKNELTEQYLANNNQYLANNSQKIKQVANPKGDFNNTSELNNNAQASNFGQARDFRQTSPVVKQDQDRSGQARVSAGRASAFATSANSWSALEVAKWPIQWQEYFQKARTFATSAVCCWSWSDYYLDLQAKDDPRTIAHRSFFQQLFRILAWPVGTHTFWSPMLEKTEVQKRENIDIFWSALHFFKVRILLYFGDDSKEVLGLPNNPTPSSYRGFYVRILPALDRLDKDKLISVVVNTLNDKTIKNILSKSKK